MRYNTSTADARGRCGSLALWMGALALVCGLALRLATPAGAVMPPAGSVIGNQSTATYTDASGQTKTATSNLVETIVQQVGSFTLVQDNTKYAAIGNTVYMPHTLTNTGNGSDSFTLTTSDIAGADTDFATNVNIYLDANGDGVPDSTTALASGLGGSYNTPSLPAGGTYGFVISMTVPATAAPPEVDQILVTATAGTPALYATASLSNTDALHVTANAAFQVNKSISVTQGTAGVTLTYTLTYKNTGAAAGTLALNDVIGSGATVGFGYVGNAVWSAGATALTDADDAGVTVGGMTILYKAITAGAVTTIDASITNIGPNVTGTITFQVSVLATALVGTSTTTNTAMYGVGAATEDTNPSSYNVLASRGAVFNDGTNAAGIPTDGANARPAAGDTDAPNNTDLLRIGSASIGQTISFSNVVWNTGNTEDSFNVTAASLAGGGGYGTWPAGTTFQLFKADGVTPLMDTNGDGTADTGAVAAGASYVVVLKVALPAGACPAGVCPSGPFDVQKTVVSVGDPAQTNTTYDRLGSLTSAVVDLANSTIVADPLTDADPVGALTTTKAVLPGATAVFDLYVRNESSVADTYALAYGTNYAAPNVSGNLPAGWTLKFMDGATVITTVGPLAAGAEKQIQAVVTLPADAVAGTTNVFFQVKSEVTGAYDTKWDAVAVTPVNSLTLQPSNSGQVYPGGTVVYAHVLSNTGNTSCGDTFTFTISDSLAAQGWTFVLYRDVNGDGLLDAGDTVIPQVAGVYTLTYTDANNLLDLGEQVQLLVKVFAPAGAAAGATDVVSIFATGACATSNTANDTTTVVTGQVRLTKLQAIDTDCDGTADTAYTTSQLSAYPGQCILYRVTATNEGLGNVVDLKIEDSLPAFTSQFPVDIANPSTVNPVCSTGSGLYSGSVFSCAGASPAITLAPAQTAIMTFSVKVQQ